MANMVNDRDYELMLWWLKNALYWHETGQWCDKQEEYISHALEYALQYAESLRLNPQTANLAG